MRSSRWFFLPVVVLVGAYAMGKVIRLDAPFVGVSAFLVVVWFFVDYEVGVAHQGALGYDTSQFAMSIASLVAAVGSIGLSLGLVCLCDEQARSVATAWVAPGGTVQAIRAAAVLVLLVTAFFPVVRCFTGTSSFTTVVAERDQVLFPGYASPGQVEDQFRANFLREGAPVSDIHCSYFAPNLPAPPVYDCDATLRFSDGTVLHHDNIQSSGRPDGTFSCEDDTSGVHRLC